MAKVFVESVLEKQKKDGTGSFYVCAVEMDGKTVEVTVYDPKIKEFKQKEVELDVKEGKYGLIGNFPGGGGGQKREWKQTDPDSMYRCNASDKATQLVIASNRVSEVSSNVLYSMWDDLYDHIYSKMAGKPTPATVPKKEDVPDDWPPVDDPPKATDQTKASDSQKTAITGGCARLRINPDKKIVAVLGQKKRLDDLAQGEAKAVIIAINKELEATGL